MQKDSIVEHGSINAPHYLQDSRLKPGDQILQVGGILTDDITQEQAAALLDKHGPSVTITVAKMAAAYYGIFNEEGKRKTFLSSLRNAL